MLQAVVVKDTVIEPFTGSALTVDSFIKFRPSGDARMETQVCMIFYVDCAIVTAGVLWVESGQTFLGNPQKYYVRSY